MPAFSTLRLGLAHVARSALRTTTRGPAAAMAPALPVRYTSTSTMTAPKMLCYQCEYAGISPFSSSPFQPSPHPMPPISPGLFSHHDQTFATDRSTELITNYQSITAAVTLTFSRCDRLAIPHSEL